MCFNKVKSIKIVSIKIKEAIFLKVCNFEDDRFSIAC